MSVTTATNDISKNDIVFHQTYIDNRIENVVSAPHKDYFRTATDLKENNIISNNTTSPPSPRNPAADHPSILNRCTLTNTYINTGFLIPYLSNSFDPPAVSEIYYK